MTSAVTPLDALQAALSAEYAAMYVVEVLDAQASHSQAVRTQLPGLSDRLTTAFTVHRSQRDHLTALVRAAGGTPVAAEPAYDLPDAATTPAQLRSAALVTEQRCALVYGQLVGNSAGSTRVWALQVLTACALRQLGFGGTPTDFPGLH